MSTTLAIILIVAAMAASACLGAIFTSAVCRAKRSKDDRTYTDRAKVFMEEISRLKEQKEALHSKLSRKSEQ